MRIGVNARFLIYNKLEGIGRFTDEVLRQIVLKNPTHEFHFFFDREYHPSFIYSKNVIPHIVYPSARHPILYYIWFELRLPVLLKKFNCDIFLSPDGFVPLRGNTPCLPVIHDLAFEHYPQFVNGVGAAYYKYFFPKFAKKAKRIATVSDYSKQDIAKTYGIALKKIDVIYNGVSPIFKPIDTLEQQKIKNKYAFKKDYFLYVGALQPRKNITNLLKAFDLFKTRTMSTMQLVIVGRAAWQTTGIKETYNTMAFKDEVHFTGRLPDSELSLVYASAFALTYVPFFEGFGLPILESFSCGVPAITSDCSSLPEVGSDAALYVSPESVDAIANAMITLFSTPNLRTQLVNKALQRSKDFAWEKTSEFLWQSVLLTINEKD